MKICLIQKKAAFLQEDTHKARKSSEGWLSQVNYKNKVEQKLTSVNARETWQGGSIMMDRATKPTSVSSLDPTLFAD